MKQKLTLLFIALFCFLNVEAEDLTDEQRTKILNTINQYCNSLSEFAKDGNNIMANQQVINSFTDKYNLVFNDLNPSYNELTVHRYLNKIAIDYNNKLTINYQTPKTDDVWGLYNADDMSNPDKLSLARVDLTKQIKGQGINKSVKNIFIVDLQTFKIVNIVDDFSNLTSKFEDLTPLQMWQKGLEHYNKKQYEQALTWFEKSAKGYTRGQYNTGVMYLLKQGCKGMKRKERDKRGIMWLKKAAKSGYAKAREDLDRLGIYDE